jgi:hypothetical protein
MVMFEQFGRRRRLSHLMRRLSHIATRGLADWRDIMNSTPDEAIAAYMEFSTPPLLLVEVARPPPVQFTLAFGWVPDRLSQFKMRLWPDMKHSRHTKQGYCDVLPWGPNLNCGPEHFGSAATFKS